MLTKFQFQKLIRRKKRKLVDEFFKSFDSEIDSKLDSLIFDLYNLTKEEIEYIKINF